MKAKNLLLLLLLIPAFVIAQDNQEMQTLFGKTITLGGGFFLSLHTQKWMVAMHGLEALAVASSVTTLFLLVLQDTAS